MNAYRIYFHDNMNRMKYVNALSERIGTLYVHSAGYEVERTEKIYMIAYDDTLVKAIKDYVNKCAQYLVDIGSGYIKETDECISYIEDAINDALDCIADTCNDCVFVTKNQLMRINRIMKITGNI